MFIGTSTVERWQIIVLIWLLRLVTPASFLHLIASFFVPNYWLREQRILTVSSILECSFYLFVFLPRKRYLQKPAIHPTRMCRSERYELLLRCRDNIIDPETFLSGWQLESTSADKTVRRDNIKDWLLWGFFSAGSESLSDPHVADEIDEYLQILQEKLGRTIPPGRNKDIKSIRLTLDDVVICHRPFVWYMIIMLVDTLVAAWLKQSGFKHHAASQPVFPPRPHTLFSEASPSKALSYWYRPPSPSESRISDRRFTPLLFLHGIGIGLFPYVPLLRGYSKDHPDVPIIVPEILSISSRLTLPPPSQEEFLGAIRDILEHHRIQEYSITAHSYGTALAAGIIKVTNLAPPRSNDSTSTAAGGASSERMAPLPPPQSLTLLDPICLLLHLPSVARNFLYRPPRQANEHELYYFACTDPGVAHALSRHFFWTQNILWKEDLAQVGLAHQSIPRVAVVLSGNDIIVDAPAVWTYLTGLPPPKHQCDKPWPFTPPTPHPESVAPIPCAASPNVLAVYLGGFDHAQMFLSSAAWRGVLGVMDEVSAVKKSNDAVEQARDAPLPVTVSLPSNQSPNTN